MKLFSICFLLLFFFFSCLQYEEFNNEEIKMEDVIGSSNRSLRVGECSASEEYVQKFLEDNNINYKGEIDKNVKFIVGSCNPIVLIPGIYSTKLNVKLNCRNIKRNEKLLYDKIKFYCSKFVCSSDIDEDENRSLWFNLGKDGFTLINQYFEPGKENENEEPKPDPNDPNSMLYWEWDNRFSGCLGFFMTMFDSETECPILESTNKRICGHSHNIKITYEGGFLDTRKDADCGIKAVENVLSSPLKNFIPEMFWKEKSDVFANLVEDLVDIGYIKGFSLAAIPNDFRRFISTNDFAYESLKYHIENMYSITGKPVIIIAHSFGNLVTLNGLTKFPILKDKVKKWISLAPPFAGATKAVDNFLHGISDFNFNMVFADSLFHNFGQL